MIAELLAAAAVATAPDCPPPAPGQPALISRNPDWQVKPDYKDVYWAFPRRAVTERITGHATVSCEVSEQGALENCKVIEETPAGYGFGDAAVSLTAKMLMRPKLVCGAVARGTVRVPIAFAFPAENPKLSIAPLDPGDTKLTLASRLVSAMAIPDLLRADVDLQVLNLLDMMEEDREVSADERRAMQDAARETWALTQGKVLNALARLYRDRLSADEITKAIAFYESPAGVKLAGTPISDDMSEVMMAIEPDMLVDFRRRFCTRMPAHCETDDGI